MINQIANRLLTINAATYKWQAVAPKDIGIKAIRALQMPNEDDSGFTYMSFNGKYFELESPVAGVPGYRVDISKGQAIDLRKVNEALAKMDPSAPKVRQDHIVYVLGGIRSVGM